MKRFLGLISAVFVAFLAGCAPRRPADLFTHVLQFDADGNTLDLKTGKKLDAGHARAQFDAILDSMRAYFKGKPSPNVVLYVHGGLNTPDDAIANAETHLHEMTKAGDGSPYPIFVVWDSGLVDTYDEHLFDVRQGQKDSETEYAAKLDLPIYFLSGVFVAAARAPTVWLQLAGTDFDTAQAAQASVASYDSLSHLLIPKASTQPSHADIWMEHPKAIDATTFYLNFNQLYFNETTAAGAGPRHAMAISIGPDHSLPGDWVDRGTIYIIFIPTKLFFAPIIDGLGSPAWRDMQRRAQTIVDGASDFKVSRETTSQEIQGYVDNGTIGGLDSFVNALARAVAPAKAGESPAWAVTLFAHSAGSIVVNDLLRRQIQHEEQFPQRPALNVGNIVYMAAACSIRDFSDSVVPFMENANHQNTRFYNLMLHPSAEAIEAEGFGPLEIAPRGSLLCWIDDFLTTPQTPLDRTLGRWDNILQVPSVLPLELRGRMALKAFSVLRPNEKTPAAVKLDPQIHGDFSDSPFWDPTFWQPEPPLNPLTDPRILLMEREREKLQNYAPKPVNPPAN